MALLSQMHLFAFFSLFCIFRPKIKNEGDTEFPMEISTHHMRNKILFTWSAIISFWSTEIFDNQFWFLI